MKGIGSHLFVLAGVLTGVIACSSSSPNNGSGDGGAGDGDDAGGATSEDSGLPVTTVDGGYDASGSGPGGCLAGGQSATCPVYFGDAGGAGACVSTDFCLSVSGLVSEVGASVIHCEAPDVAPACDGLHACVTTALAAACPDPTTSQPCASVVSSCGDAGAKQITEATCEATLAGFNISTRTIFANCMATSCDVSHCIDTLFVD